jgi:hypothetical protein
MAAYKFRGCIVKKPLTEDQMAELSQLASALKNGVGSYAFDNRHGSDEALLRLALLRLDYLERKLDAARALADTYILGLGDAEKMEVALKNFEEIE